MKVIGITGPTGAGKSLFSDFLRGKGIPVIDADKLYHSLLVPPSSCLDALRGAFGDGVFLDSGELDRRALSEIVFHDSEKLELLNRTVLGFVLDRARELLSGYEKDGEPMAAVDAPTLIESGFYRECHTVISVLCPPDVRIGRIMSRDGLSEDAARARVSAQKDDGFYIERSDTVLTNDGDTESFLKRCEQTLSELLEN